MALHRYWSGTIDEASLHQDHRTFAEGALEHLGDTCLINMNSNDECGATAVPALTNIAGRRRRVMQWIPGRLCPLWLDQVGRSLDGVSPIGQFYDTWYLDSLFATFHTTSRLKDAMIRSWNHIAKSSCHWRLGQMRGRRSPGS